MLRIEGGLVLDRWPPGGQRCQARASAMRAFAGKSGFFRNYQPLYLPGEAGFKDRQWRTVST
jgi:hypothetical protein